MYCSHAFNLSDEDLQLRLPSGQSVFFDRVGWARTYLKKAGLIDSPSRANFCLTQEGKKALKNGAHNVTLAYLQQYSDFSDWIRNSGTLSHNSNTHIETDAPQSPEEMIANACAQINASLQEELLSEIMKMSPYAFEKLVVKLLKKVGYGGEFSEDIVTPKSGDEGIDGIITTDKLGFDAIYVQAKRWKPDSVVGRPEIQKFLGALAGQGATKGLFITTAKFSKEACLFVEKQLHSKIILINGDQLIQLMIEHNLGVSTIATYEIKRPNFDFFMDE